MKIPQVATKTQHSQINYYFLKKKKAGHKPTEAVALGAGVGKFGLLVHAGSFLLHLVKSFDGKMPYSQ